MPSLTLCTSSHSPHAAVPCIAHPSRSDRQVVAGRALEQRRVVVLRPRERVGRRAHRARRAGRVGRLGRELGRQDVRRASGRVRGQRRLGVVLALLLCAVSAAFVTLVRSTRAHARRRSVSRLCVSAPSASSSARWWSSRLRAAMKCGESRVSASSMFTATCAPVTTGGRGVRTNRDLVDRIAELAEDAVVLAAPLVRRVRRRGAVLRGRVGLHCGSEVTRQVCGMKDPAAGPAAAKQHGSIKLD